MEDFEIQDFEKALDELFSQFEKESSHQVPQSVTQEILVCEQT